ncbi:MAG: DUF4384 domain-containing protein [Pyrinomonadaceae bacterium]
MFKNDLPAKLLIAVILSLILATAGFAQEKQDDDDDPPTRSITSKDFKAKRAKSSGGAARKKSVTTNSNRRYRHSRRKTVARKKSAGTVKMPVGEKTPVFQTEELGVTFWRLRPLKSFEVKAPGISTISVKIDSRRWEDWTAERVNSTTRFSPGDRVRFTIESPRTGYLYIINREFYTDGSVGEASLIFPTLRTRGGDNRVRAGSLIEVPAASDGVAYFTITPRREDYAGEELAVIITKDPIPGIEIGRQPIRLTPERVAQWIEDWGSTMDIYDAEDGEGIAYSVEESDAANSTSRELTQEEPLPQTLYRVRVRDDLPLVALIQMQATVP